MQQITHDAAGRWFKALIFVTSLGLVGLVGVGHYWAGPEVAFSIFYLPPIALTAWYLGKRVGVLLAVVSAVAWFAADQLAGHVYTHPLVPYWNFVSKAGLFLFAALAVHRLQVAFDQERNNARKDSLTGVGNSRAFLELANVELNHARRNQTTLAVAYLDIDDFKRVNDRYGHGIGDSVLAAVADTIRKWIRATDVVARLGGDEFAVLFSDTSPESIHRMVRDLHKQLLVTMDNIGWPITVSIGTAVFTSPPQNVEDMIKRADNLMYSVKNNGKNTIRYEIFDGSGSVQAGCLTPFVRPGSATPPMRVNEAVRSLNISLKEEELC